MVLYKSSPVQLKQQIQRKPICRYHWDLCPLKVRPLVKLSIILGNKSLSFANPWPLPPLSFSM